MNTIIFGCGNIGRWTLGFIGKERVDYFCDNNLLLIGKYVEGIEVISYEELLKLYNKDDALIIVGMNGNNAEGVAEQLELDGIYDFVVAEQISGYNIYGNIKDETFLELCNKSIRQEYAIKYLKLRLEKQKNRVNYFKKHTDIRYMKPAVGRLRAEQLHKVKLARETLDFLEENCSIKCWITGGTLIGKLRHDGFVPWDDDVDFGIMREDVYKLINFFDGYSVVHIPETGFFQSTKDEESEINKTKTLEEVAYDYKGRYVLLLFPDFMRIYKQNDDLLEMTLELFPFDFYNDCATIGDYHDITIEAFTKKKDLPTVRKAFDWCQEKINNSNIISKEKTNKILPGIDSFIYRGLWNIEEFMSYDVIFPLNEIVFEGEKFYSVNQPELYITHEYPNWMEFPNDIGAEEE